LTLVRGEIRSEWRPTMAFATGSTLDVSTRTRVDGVSAAAVSVIATVCPGSAKREPPGLGGPHDDHLSARLMLAGRGDQQPYAEVEVEGVGARGVALSALGLDVLADFSSPWAPRPGAHLRVSDRLMVGVIVPRTCLWTRGVATGLLWPRQAQASRGTVAQAAVGQLRRENVVRGRVDVIEEASVPGRAGLHASRCL